MQSIHNQNTTHQPSPTAARVLSKLVEYNYAPTDPPDLPPAWQPAFEAVLRVRAGSRRERLDAFKSAIEGHPHAYEMLQEVVDFTEGFQDRTEQHRLLYSAKDALADPPAFDWLVEPYFTLPSFNILVGNPGAKKTLLAIDLAVSVAAGHAWLGAPTGPSSVLYVDEDLGLNRLWARLNASFRAHSITSEIPLYFTSLAGYDLRSPEDADALTNRALSVDARLIILDALPNLMHGSAENNLSAVQPVLFHLRRLAEHCRAAVLAIHHTNREGAFRGSSAISASADLMLSISSAPNSNRLTLRTLKARSLAPRPLTARAAFETDPDGRDLVSFTPLKPDASRGEGVAFSKSLPPASSGVAFEMLEYLSTQETASRRQLTRHLAAYNPGSVRNTLHKLIQSGYITRANPGSRGTKALYALSRPS